MMLEEQEKQLLQLIEDCEHPWLKLLLATASHRWISGEITPIRNNYGVVVKDGKYQNSCGSACLIGTAMIGFNSSCLEKLDDCYDYLSSDFENLFKFSHEEHVNIVNLFDGDISEFQLPSNEPIEKTLTELYRILFL